MNFLAHAFLSGENEDLILGNMLADFIRGGIIDVFNPGIQKGILLHREIDNFTDHHPVVERTKVRLRPVFNHYSPVVGDMFYDHFLAANFAKYSPIPLGSYAKIIFRIMDQHNEILPDRLKKFMDFVRFLKIFESYASIEGMEEVLEIMARRTNYISHLELGGQELRKNYEHYEADFKEFFPELIGFVNQRIKEIS